MPTSCPPTLRCNTYATGWLNGTHPTVADGQVSRQVCFHGRSNCCNWSTNIKVRNCSSYYVYYLSGTPGGLCDIRYCGTNWKQGASKVIHNAIKKRKKKEDFIYHFNIAQRTTRVNKQEQFSLNLKEDIKFCLKLFWRSSKKYNYSNRTYQEDKLGTKITHLISNTGFCVISQGNHKYTLSPRTPCSC